MRKTYLILIIFVLVFVLSAFSTAPTEEATDPIIKSPPLLTVRGTIRMIGNEPFTKVIIEAENGDLLQVSGGTQYELAKHQGSRIVAFGRVTRIVSREVEFNMVVRNYTLKNGEE